MRLDAGEAGEDVGEGHSVGQCSVRGRIFLNGIRTLRRYVALFVVGGDGAGGVVSAFAEDAVDIMGAAHERPPSLMVIMGMLGAAHTSPGRTMVCGGVHPGLSVHPIEYEPDPLWSRVG